MSESTISNQVALNREELFKEESYTDRKVGTIKKLIPIKDDESIDESRSTIYIGQTQMMTPMGALPLNFEIQAENLSDAITQFSIEAQKSVEETLAEIQRIQREQASSIVIPGQGQSPQAMPGGMSGGMGGGIHMP